MTTHNQINEYLQKTDDMIQYAQEQLNDARRVQPGDPGKFSEAQLELQQFEDELLSIIRSATPEQRDQLERARHRVREMQNEMILKH